MREGLGHQLLARNVFDRSQMINHSAENFYFYLTYDLAGVK